MLLLEKLSKRFGEKILFEDLSLSLPTGDNIALVGQNGAGKSTLLNILCGIDEPDGGSIKKEKDARVGYLPQEPCANPLGTVLQECESGAKRLHEVKQRLDEALQEMAENHSDELIARHGELEHEYRMAGGYSLTSRATSILVGLGFSDEKLSAPPLSLSGGWRMRLELAKIFLNEPEILILDEPTNHLDLPSLVWVEAWLKQFRGTLIFVSHDRALLNRLAHHTLHLSHGNGKLYSGNFDAFLRQKDAHREQEEAERSRIQKKVEEHQKFVDRFGAKASKARQAQSRLKMIGKLRSLEDGLSEEVDEKALTLSIPEPLKSGREVLKVHDLAIGYERDKALAEGIDLEIERGQKVAIIGANGIGKSTFLKTLIGELEAINGQVTFGHNIKTAYFDQNQGERLDPNATLMETVLQVSEDIGQAEARKLLGGLLFPGDDVFKKAGVLSGGEKNRLGMACLLAQKANLLLLDEPTNHLDMTSVEVLIEALGRFSGTVMFVSHDRTFIDSLATHILVMLPDGRSRLFYGQLDDYQRAAAETAFPNVLEAESSLDEKVEAAPTEGVDLKPPKPHADIKSLRTERNRLQKQVTKFDKRQEEIKGELESHEKNLLSIDPSDYEALSNTKNVMESLESELAKVEESWLEASEKIEEITEKIESQGRK